MNEGLEVRSEGIVASVTRMHKDYPNGRMEASAI